METFKVGIDPSILIALSVGVITITELIKKSGIVADGYGLLVACVLSLIGIGLCAMEFNIRSPLGLFLGFASILSQAAGAWGISRASSNPQEITTVRKLAMLLLAVLIPVATLSGCASRTNNRAGFVRADSAIYTGLAALQDTAIALNKAGALNDADHKKVHAALAPALRTGLNINRVIRSWPADAPAPNEIRELVTQVADLTRAVLQEVPPGTARDRLTLGITVVQQAILAVMVGVQAPIPVASTGVDDGAIGERSLGVGTGRRPTDTDWARDARLAEGGLLAAR